MPNSVIVSKPLVGRGSIFPKSRIVIWDFQKNEAFFVGVIDSIPEHNFAQGRDYYYDRSTREWGFRRIRLNLEISGLTPYKGSIDLFSPDYRMFRLPDEFKLEDRAKFRVTFKVPDRLETIVKIIDLRNMALKQVKFVDF